MRSLPRLRALLLALVLPLLVLPLASPASADGAAGGPQLETRSRVLPVGAPPVPPEVVAHGWMVADLDTGAVLAAQDPHGRYAPASTLKVLTATALMPLLPDRSRKVVPSYDDIAVDGSKVGLVERVGYPVDELFAAMMMVSGNDVANTLADAAGGPAAIQAMNATAARLQAHDTRAVNPSGLDAEGQYSSAYDLGLIARAAMQEPDFRRWVSTLHGSVSGPGAERIQTYNHDKLLTSYPGAIGIKNGYTSSAKASFVGAATRDGRTLVVTLMRTQPRVHAEAAALLDWGFAAARLGVQPVGQLVDPEAGQTETPVAPAPAPAYGQPTALARTQPPAQDGGPSVPALSLGAVAVTVLALRARRRRILRARRLRRPVPLRRR